MRSCKINVLLVIALLCLHVRVLAKGGRSSSRGSSRSSSSRSSSRSSGSSSSGSSWHSSGSSGYGSSGSSHSLSSSSWGSSSRSSNSPSHSSSSHSYNSNTASSGGIWQSFKNFFGFGSGHSSQSNNIPVPTIISYSSPSHSYSQSTSTNHAHQRFSPAESDSRNLHSRGNATSSESNTLNAPSTVYDRESVITIIHTPSNAHTNISPSNFDSLQYLYSAPFSTTTSDSNHNQGGSATSRAGFLSHLPYSLPLSNSYHSEVTTDSTPNSYYSTSNGMYSSGPATAATSHLPSDKEDILANNAATTVVPSLYSGRFWSYARGLPRETPQYSSELSTDNTPNSYHTSNGMYSSGPAAATSHLASVKENNEDEDSGKLKIQKTCTEILNKEGQISELLKRICSPYTTDNRASTTSTPITDIPTQETTISPATLAPCAVLQEKDATPPKMVCRKAQQSILDEHAKLVESLKEICEPDTTTNTPTKPTIYSSSPTETSTTTTTAEPIVESTFSIILPPTPDVG